MLPFYELSRSRPTSGPKRRGRARSPRWAPTHRGGSPEWVPGLQHHQVKALDCRDQATPEDHMQRSDENMEGLGRGQGPL